MKFRLIYIIKTAIIVALIQVNVLAQISSETFRLSYVPYSNMYVSDTIVFSKKTYLDLQKTHGPYIKYYIACFSPEVVRDSAMLNNSTVQIKYYSSNDILLLSEYFFQNRLDSAKIFYSNGHMKYLFISNTTNHLFTAFWDNGVAMKSSQLLFENYGIVNEYNPSGRIKSSYEFRPDHRWSWYSCVKLKALDYQNSNLIYEYSNDSITGITEHGWYKNGKIKFETKTLEMDSLGYVLSKDYFYKSGKIKSNVHTTFAGTRTIWKIKDYRRNGKIKAEMEIERKPA